MSNTAPSRADPMVVFPLGQWCPPLDKQVGRMRLTDTKGGTQYRGLTQLCCIPCQWRKTTRIITVSYTICCLCYEMFVLLDHYRDTNNKIVEQDRVILLWFYFVDPSDLLYGSIYYMVVQCTLDISRLLGSKQWYHDISGSAIYRPTVMGQNQDPFFSTLWGIMGLLCAFSGKFST